MFLPTGEQINRSGVTDKKGKVAFEFESSVLPEETDVVFQARQAHLNIPSGGTVFVAVRPFRAEMKTPRTLYLSEEPVEFSVVTKDLKGEPIAQAMTVTALLRVQSGGTWSETKADSTSVTTDAKTGQGKATFKLIKGGTYILRAEGKDRFDHTVTAEATVQVSDDDDATKLRIFTEKQTYRVGDTVAVDVHSRVGKDSRKEDGSDQGAETSEQSKIQNPKSKIAGGPFLALVTFEGEEIIGYRTLPVAPGHN